MIIARLQGGLGNQLFQYAAAKALAVHLGKVFKLETVTTLQRNKFRKIALTDFQAGFELASKEEIKKFIYLPFLYRHKPAIFKMGKNIYHEPYFHFDEKFFQLNDPVFLDGFWQSPLYFKKIDSIIRQDFVVKPKLIKNVIQKGKELGEKTSVAIHIRRGDFLHPAAAVYHGILNESYYTKAMQLVREKIPAASFHFFSDDIDWVKRNLALDKKAEFVSSFTQSAIEDFYLMSKCRHNIIANSSFSWWPAWLNNNRDKIVIAPKNWFADPKINTNDLVPHNWIRI